MVVQNKWNWNVKYTLLFGIIISGMKSCWFVWQNNRCLIQITFVWCSGIIMNFPLKQNSLAKYLFQWLFSCHNIGNSMQSIIRLIQPWQLYTTVQCLPVQVKVTVSVWSFPPDHYIHTSSARYSFSSVAAVTKILMFSCLLVLSFDGVMMLPLHHVTVLGPIDWILGSGTGL